MTAADDILLLAAQNGIVQMIHIRNAEIYGCDVSIPKSPDKTELFPVFFFSEIRVGLFILFSFYDRFLIYFIIKGTK
jgi:hypothetical protein